MFFSHKYSMHKHYITVCHKRVSAFHTADKQQNIYIITYIQFKYMSDFPPSIHSSFYLVSEESDGALPCCSGATLNRHVNVVEGFFAQMFPKANWGTSD